MNHASFRLDVRAALEVLDEKAIRLMRRSFRKTMRKTIRRLGHTLTAAADAVSPDDLRILVAFWSEEVDSDLLPYIEAVFRAGSISAAGSLGDEVQAALGAMGVDVIDGRVTSAAVEYLRGAANRLRGFGDDAWNAAREALAEGMEAGEGITALSSRLSGVLDLLDWQLERIARTEVITAANAGALSEARALGEFGPPLKYWLATGDDATDEECLDLDGEGVPLDDTFSSGDDAPPAHANCRCTLVWAPNDEGTSMMNLDDAYDEAATEEGADQEVVASGGFCAPTPTLYHGGTDMGNLAIATELAEAVAVPPPQWHALMAVEGVRTGDGREFAPGALVWRDLPLPLEWQKVRLPEHEGSTVVGRIDRIERIGDEVHGWGILDTGSADGAEFFRQLGGDGGEQFVRGVSVDVDDVKESDIEITMPQGEQDNPFAMPELVKYNHGRIMGLTGVSGPALQEAFIELGMGVPAASGEPAESPASPSSDGYSESGRHYALEGEKLGPTGGSVSDAPWDGSASRFNDDQYKRAAAACDGLNPHPKQDCFLPHHEPDGTINRNGVHAAAQRASALSGHPPESVSRAKAHLRSHYASDLKEDAPPSIGGVAEAVATALETLDYALVDGFGDEVFAVAGIDRDRFVQDLVSLRLALAPPELEPTSLDVLVASAIPISPPAEWFMEPVFDGPTRQVTVTPEGRIYGQLFRTGECHLSVGPFSNVCMMPPTDDDFGYFLTGDVETAEQTLVPVGRLVMGTHHAARGLKPQPAMEHYENVEFARADVAMGWGPAKRWAWFSGALRPDTTPEQIRALRASNFSGDWRRIGGRLRLIAALACNAPGFPIPRPTAALVGGQQVSLVAAGSWVDDETPASRMAERILRSVGMDPKTRVERALSRVKGN